MPLPKIPHYKNEPLWQSMSGFHDYRLEALKVVEGIVSTKYYV